MLLVGVAALVRAQGLLPDGFGEHPGFEAFSNGTGIGLCPEVNVTTGLSITSSGQRCTLSAIGGPGGGGAPPPLVFSTCGVWDGTTPLFLKPGGCGDPAEANAQTPFKNAATFGSIACFFGGATGAQLLTGALRSGTCGGSLSSSTVTCTTAGGGAPGCDGAATASIVAGQCVSLRASGTGLVPTPGVWTCLVEIVG